MAMQPPVLTNRFIINLRSLSIQSSFQDSSVRQHWSRFSTPNFRIPGSFLGNIGEDLQDGHEPADDYLDGHHTMDAVCSNAENSLEAAMLEEASTAPGFFTSHLADMQVSLRIHSESKRCERTPFHLGWSPG